MEKKHGEMAAKYDTKIEYIENHFDSIQEGLKRNSDKLEYMEEVFEKKCDGVAKLEGQYQCVADRIKLLDENLEDIEIKIEASTNLVEKL